MIKEAIMMKKKLFRTNCLLPLSILFLLSSCGPSCPEAKSALDDSQIMSEDVARVNRLVSKRNSVIAQAGAGNLPTQTLERIQFTALALEQAVKLQVRIIKLSPRYEKSPLYTGQAPLINNIRCYFDRLLDSKMVFIARAQARKIHRFKRKFTRVAGTEGALNLYEIKKYLKQGIQITE